MTQQEQQQREQERREKALQVAAVALAQITAGADEGIINSWGLKNPTATHTADGAPALVFEVNGLQHRGRVIVALNEGADLYTIILIDSNGREVKRFNEIYCDELTALLDAEIERRPEWSETEYHNRLKAQGDALLNWALTAQEQGREVSIIQL